MIALDAKTGKELWRQKAADIKEGYSMTVAPLVADGVRDDRHLRRRVRHARLHRRLGSGRPASICGAPTRSPAPGEPGGDTWQGDTWKLGGGSTWITGSYDPELQHRLLGHRQSRARSTPAVRPGDNLYTCSVLALDPKTGKIKWHYQFSPNNPFDYDSVAEMVLADTQRRGQADARC